MRWGDSMLRLITLTVGLLAGCVYAPLPDLPPLPPIGQVAAKTEAINGNQRETEAFIKHAQPRDSPAEKTDAAASQCPSLPMPEPIPKQLRIKIGYGADKADDNGKRLLTNYKELRKAIKKKWHSKPP
jgi:hypothetical protein